MMSYFSKGNTDVPDSKLLSVQHGAKTTRPIYLSGHQALQYNHYLVCDTTSDLKTYVLM